VGLTNFAPRARRGCRSSCWLPAGLARARRGIDGLVAGRSFAMGQSPPEVKKAATDVLERGIETGGGIAEAIEKAFGK